MQMSAAENGGMLDECEAAALKGVTTPIKVENHAVDEFDELFFMSNNERDNSTEKALSAPDEVILDAYTSSVLSSPERNVAASKCNSAMDSPTKDISPIRWDRVSESEQMPDVVNVDTTENEFSKESEEVPKLEPFRHQSPVSDVIDQATISEDLNLNTIRDFDQLFCNTKYFLIKSNNHENIDIAKSKNAWATTVSNENRLNKAYFDANNVLLIFSVKESGRFQGFARLSSPSDPRLHVNWVLPPRMSSNMLSSPFKLDWITKNELPFNNTSHLTNAWNEGKPVKIGRDGQEIEPSCGQALCRLFSLDRVDQLPSIVKKIEPKRQSGSQNYEDSIRRRNAFDRLGASSRSSHPSSRRSHDLGIRSGHGSVGLLGAVASSTSASRSNIPSLMSQVNPAAAALAAAMSALTPNQQQNSLLPPADIARLIAMNPSLATQLLAQPGTPLLASLHGVQQGTISSTQDRRSQYRRSRSRSRGRSSSSGGRRSHDSREYRRRRGDHHYRSAQGRGSERRGEDYSRSPKDSSYRYSRYSRERSRGSRHDRDRRSDHGSTSPRGTDSLANWNYEDYLQQVSRGLHTNLNPLMNQGRFPMQAPTNVEADRLYEERVNAFLRNDPHAPSSSGARRRSRNRSRSRSPSSSPRSYSPSPPPPRPRYNEYGDYENRNNGGINSGSDEFYGGGRRRGGSRPRDRSRVNYEAGYDRDYLR